MGDPADKFKNKIKQQQYKKSSKIFLPQQAPQNPDFDHPKISLRHLQKDYCLTKCEPEEKISFAEKIRLITSQSWADLRLAPSHGLGYEKIKQKEIRAGIPSCVSKKQKIIAFRFSGKKPMVGFKKPDGTFYILWFDRDFTLYDHG